MSVTLIRRQFPTRGDRAAWSRAFLLSHILALIMTLACVPGANSQATEGDEVIRQEPFNVVGRSSSELETSALGVHFDHDAPAIERTLSGLAGSVPNLHVGSGGAGSFGDTISLRGLTNTPYFSDPAVTVYLDDLPLGNSFTYPVNLAMFSNATVHMGPQGTAFGRSGEGGVIVLESTPPGLRAAGEVRLGAGDYGARSMLLVGRSARGETADATVGFWHQELDGFISNTALGIRVDRRNETGGQARIRLQPAEGAEITLQLLGQRSRNGAQPLVPLGGPFFVVNREPEGRTDGDSFGVALKGRFDLPAGILTAVTSYTDWKLNPYESHLVLPPGIDSRVVQDQSTWNEEISLRSRLESRVDWTAGLWLSRSKTEGDVHRELTGLFPIEGSHFALDSHAMAMFGQASVPASDRVRLTAGLRAERTRRSFDRSETIPTPGRFTDDANFDALLAKLRMDCSLAPGVTAHAMISTGTKPGGFSAYTGNSALAPFDAERVLAFDSGIETERADKSLTFAVSGFAYFIRDYQIERSFTQTDYLVVNAPRARSVGGEFSADWQPAGGWQVQGGLGVSVVTLREFRDPFSGTDYSGNRAPYAPVCNAHLQVEYRDPSGWFGGIGVVLTGKTTFDESEDPLFTQDAYTVVDARLGFDSARWRLTVYGRNLTDESYYAFIVPGVNHGAPGAPRTQGAEFSMKF